MGSAALKTYSTTQEPLSQVLIGYKIMKIPTTSFDYNSISKVSWGVLCVDLSPQELTFLLTSFEGTHQHCRITWSSQSSDRLGYYLVIATHSQRHHPKSNCSQTIAGSQMARLVYAFYASATRGCIKKFRGRPQDIQFAKHILWRSPIKLELNSRCLV